MNFYIPEIQVGDPSVCGNVAVLPLFSGLSFSGGDLALDYLLAHEALAAGTVEVREVSEEGSVGTLLADNGGDQPVLSLEGEELTGAKQNRAVSTTTMIPAKCQTRIPVRCVQRGKWIYSSSRKFGAGSYCPPTLRLLLKRGHGSRFDSQTAIWREIRRKHRAIGTRAEQENMSDSLETHREAVERVRGGLRYPEGASGMAVAIGDKVVSVDVFDTPVTLAKLWDRLVQGVAIDALEFPATGCQTSVSDISVRLYRMQSVRWRRSESIVGLGETYRARDNDDDALAMALVNNGRLVHLSISIPI